MILLTGAAGFIGSQMGLFLNEKGRTDIVLVDDFSHPGKDRNWKNIKAQGLIHRDRLFEEWQGRWTGKITLVMHLGARTDTAEMDESVFNRLNLGFSQKIWEFCSRENIPLIYASSAATYGLGEHGFSDDITLLQQLKPLNPYGWSKHRFDLWALEQNSAPPFWAGLKFFNVFGPGEAHKGRMASVVYHAWYQILKTGKLNLFRSHKPEFSDGGQQRDFIYVKDILKIMFWMMENKPQGKIFNLGTGQARTFLDLGSAVFDALGKQRDIHFIDTPADIREHYQYFTQAETTKLRSAGWLEEFTDLEAAVNEYINKYLRPLQLN